MQAGTGTGGLFSQAYQHRFFQEPGMQTSLGPLASLQRLAGISHPTPTGAEASNSNEVDGAELQQQQQQQHPAGTAAAVAAHNHPTAAGLANPAGLTIDLLDGLLLQLSSRSRPTARAAIAALPRVLVPPAGTKHAKQQRQQQDQQQQRQRQTPEQREPGEQQQEQDVWDLSQQRECLLRQGRPGQAGPTPEQQQQGEQRQEEHQPQQQQQQQQQESWQLEEHQQQEQQQPGAQAAHAAVGEPPPSLRATAQTEIGGLSSDNNNNTNTVPAATAGAPAAPDSTAAPAAAGAGAEAEAAGAAAAAIEAAFCTAGEPCTVCHEEFVAGCEVVVLPCRHCFHEACLLPWLSEVSAGRGPGQRAGGGPEKR